MIYNRLIISAGGIRIYNYIGVLKYLFECNLLNNITHYYGCWAGGFLCSLLYIGYSISEIEFEFSSIDKQQFYNKFNLNFFIKQKSFYNNYNMIKYIIILISKKHKMNITLKELYIITKKKLFISVTNLSKNNIEYISVDNYPDIELWKVIIMTISIPFLFPAFKYLNNYYVDGALIESIPYAILNDQQLKKSIIIGYDYYHFLNNIDQHNIYNNNFNRIDINFKNIFKYIKHLFNLNYLTLYNIIFRKNYLNFIAIKSTIDILDIFYNNDKDKDNINYVKLIKDTYYYCISNNVKHKFIKYRKLSL